MKETKSRNPAEGKHPLPRQTAGLFTDPYEWCLVDWIYWRSHTRTNRKWTCTMEPIQENTPVKHLETITATLERLCGKAMGFSKVPFGKPQKRRAKGGTFTEPKQSYQYSFDAIVFEAWLENTLNQQPEAIGKRIDPYRKSDSIPIGIPIDPLSEIRKTPYRKSDTKTITENNLSKEFVKEGYEKNGVGLNGSAFGGSVHLQPVLSSSPSKLQEKIGTVNLELVEQSETIVLGGSSSKSEAIPASVSIINNETVAPSPMGSGLIQDSVSCSPSTSEAGPSSSCPKGSPPASIGSAPVPSVKKSGPDSPKGVTSSAPANASPNGSLSPETMINVRFPLVPKDTHLWCWYAMDLQRTPENGKFTPYGKLHPDAQRVCRDHVARNRGKVEVGYLKFRSECLAELKK
jgi:hypothetical protein